MKEKVLSVSPEIAMHEVKVAELCVELCRELGGLSEDDVESLRVAALNHDIGKYFISERVLNAPRGLSTSERVAVDMHAYLGYLKLKEEGICDKVCQIVLLHHGASKFKGGVVVDNVDVIWLSEILRACDIYIALRENRVYKAPLGVSEAFDIINKDDSIAVAIKDALKKVVLS